MTLDDLAVGWIPYRILQVLSACSRRERRLRVERDVLQVLGHEWTGAKDIADQIGWSWQIVARTLQRMAEEDRIEGRVQLWVARKSRVKRTHLYRRKQVRAIPPPWLEQRAVPLVGGGNVRMIVGMGMVGRSVRRK